ncbi:hypothetical protein H6G74_18910 [Nostoc spongiaeforme FACHB-130]|uniref:Uncharacterized protein n=1 Tax=Nostoc spongiaeforme FACHB-130 TaxID=1357510 RepID=A0ABR8FY87_9NOSO|nr:hypothetical protein [Nostoc spongiaeforme]MBD2596385.1 hypothetical protein [Nostoc spongiaeforme FACHB-130]
MSVGSALGRQPVALFAKVVASGVRLSLALRLLNSYECVILNLYTKSYLEDSENMPVL